MSWDAKQYALIGIWAEVDDLKIVDVDAIFEDQNQYDIRTGKITGVKSVMVKDEECHYAFLGCEGEYLDNLIDALEIKYKMRVIQIEDLVYIGDLIGGRHSYGNVDMLEDAIDFDELIEVRDVVRAKCPDIPFNMIQIHFFSHAG